MASTVTKRRWFDNSEVYVVDLDITSYPTNGEAVTSALLGLPSGSDPLILGVVGLEDNVFGRHDEVNDKLILFDEGGEIANATDVGVVRLMVATRNA